MTKPKKKLGWFGKLFARGVASKLRKNSDLMSAVNKTDEEMEKARDRIEKTAGDKETVKKAVPKEVRDYLGFDY